MDLFTKPETRNPKPGNEPLAVRIRPRSLDDFTGQEHILGAGKLLRRLIDSDKTASLILYGPPGCGKTTLALMISARTKSRFERINAASNNVADMRRIIDAAKKRDEQVTPAGRVSQQRQHVAHGADVVEDDGVVA